MFCERLRKSFQRLKREALPVIYPCPFCFISHNLLPLKLYIGNKSLRWEAGKRSLLRLSKISGIADGFG